MVQFSGQTAVIILIVGLAISIIALKSPTGQSFVNRLTGGNT